MKLWDNVTFKLLGIKNGIDAELTLKVESGSLIVMPAREVNKKDSEDEIIQKAFEKIMKRYTPAKEIGKKLKT